MTSQHDVLRFWYKDREGGATRTWRSPGEVARLEEALTVERSRVDRTLAAFLAPQEVSR